MNTILLSFIAGILTINCLFKKQVEDEKGGLWEVITAVFLYVVSAVIFIFLAYILNNFAVTFHFLLN
jgi:hypothetical protein